MTFWKTVAAYLTGWVIAQSIFTRVVRHVQRHQTEEFKDEVARYVARHLADELESRSKELGALRDVNQMVIEFTHEELAQAKAIGAVPDDWLVRLSAASGRASVFGVMGR